MLGMYRAIINGNEITWLDKPPTPLNGVEASITLVHEEASLSRDERRRALAEILAHLAESNPFGDIQDPVAWQATLREDRSLPQRN